MNKSKILSCTKEEFQKLFDESNTKSEILKKLDATTNSGHFTMLNNRIKSDNINLDRFKDNRTKFIKNKYNGSLLAKIESKNILVEHSDFGRASLKKRLIDEKLIDYNCAICNNKGVWMNASLVLQLDHINGINNDNRLENLRFLCANCHSQTDTFSGRNTKNGKQENKCLTCGIKIHKTSAYCIKCVASTKPKKFNPIKKELEKFILIDRLPYSIIGKKYNVSGTTVKKRCMQLGIAIPIIEKN
jgi:5-methylcytosine-specific restriction endonuclease McrA